MDTARIATRASAPVSNSPDIYHSEKCVERKPYIIKINFTFYVRYTVSASLEVFQVIKGEWQRQNRYAMRTLLDAPFLVW